MQLTILNQFYAPDLAPTGRLAASLAEHRAERGDQVTVVAGRGGYAAASEPAPPAGDSRIDVHRLWTPGLGRGSLSRRLADYAWFYLTAGVRLLTLPPQDTVIAMTTPPFIAWAGVLHRLLHPATRLILWCMDCYPEALTSAELITEHGWLARSLHWQNAKLIRRLDQLVCPDSAMAKLLDSRYSSVGQPLPITVISNWETAARFEPAVVQTAGLAVDRPNDGTPPYIIHMGNAGYGHAFDTVVDAAAVLQADPVGFKFIGGGARWQWLESAGQSRALAHWQLIPYLPEDQLLRALAAACCALITLRDSFLGVISPSKLHAALALGIPVLYIGPQGSNVDEAIQRFGCGASVRHGDVRGVVHFLRRLTGDAGFARDLRQRARRAFESAYSEAQAWPAFDRLIEGRSG